MVEKNIRVASASTDGVQKLDRSKLQRKIDYSGNEDGASSIKSIIMLVIVIVLVAITGAYVVKNLQPSNDTSNNLTPTPEVSITPQANNVAMVINEDVEKDMFDEFKLEGKTYTNMDSSVGGDSKSEFELANFETQPFESFYRLVFDFDKVNIAENTEEVSVATSGTGSSADGKIYTDIPSVDVNYRNRNSGFEQIEIIFSNITEDDIKLTDIFGSSMSFVIKDSSVSEISYKDLKDGELVFVLDLVDFMKYNIQVVDNKVIVDVEEKEKRGGEVVTPIVSVTPEVSPAANASVTPVASPTIKPSTTPTQTPAVSSSFKVDVQPQNITSASKARISGYTFDDTTSKFTYYLKLAGVEVPRVSTRMNADNTLEMKIEELSFDGLTKDGKGFTDFSKKGVKDILAMNLTFGGTTSNYVFTLNSKKNYKVSVQNIEGVNTIVLEIMH
jgi:hypothetical protein